jgi:hypothetical protein
MLARACFVGAFAVLAANASAASLLSDSFNYTVGSDLNDNNWIAQGFTDLGGMQKTVSATDLAFPGTTSAGGSAKVNAVEMVRNISGLSSESEYWVSARMNKADATGRLSVIFRQGWNQAQVTSFGLAGAGIVQAGNGNYNSSNGSTSWTSSTGATVPGGTTAFLLAKLNVPSKTISVWNVTDVDNVPLTPDVVHVWAAAELPGSIGMGYNGNTQLNNLIDEINITTLSSELGITFAVPEPASLSLLAGATMLGLRRRRC